MSDDIRNRSDTLKDSTTGKSDNNNFDIHNRSDTLKSDIMSNSTLAGSTDSNLRTNQTNSYDNTETGHSNDNSSVLDKVKQSIVDSTNDIHGRDFVPKTGLDDTSNDKVLDFSEIGHNKTLTEMAGSGKEAAFGVLDALSGRGPNVKPGVPLEEQQDARAPNANQ